MHRIRILAVALLMVLGVAFSIASGSDGGSSGGSSESGNWYDDKYGSFAPVESAGSSADTIDIPAGAEAGLVTASYTGSANFIVNGLDANNQPTGDLLVNTIGAYSGTTAFGLSSVGEATKLEVQASGPWTITVAPISSAPAIPAPASGTGDVVHLYDGKAADWTMTHSGSSNFIVAQYGKSLPNLAVNEIGAYEGTVAMQAGPSVITIQSDGAWTVTPK